ncbi:hypothetical protein TraAM80_03453 [Trypanosoma rangeli]|uniref:Uncharacterized protein n=1 Tax=Trypanosoma rangeli TaxID=5698 RepID=A0A3R7MSB6_TRYRA|nr:uncharacterized protein TraAM80_03453 [Trypanosoma rangeli]RNF07317.1 hypothetical protein TraAM80_03453 [Trypanosoma rangeli]|eukprot:RNF07317.1 hypothetical protein TraAM80_03453 [Trypanosoma rangeli]
MYLISCKQSLIPPPSLQPRPRPLAAMVRDGDEPRSTEALLTELQRLRSDPVLQPYMGGRSARPPMLKEAAAKEGTSLGRDGAESLVDFQTRLSREEENRLRNSLKAQRAFQQALQSLEARRTLPEQRPEGRTVVEPSSSYPDAVAGHGAPSFEPHTEAVVRGMTAAARMQDTVATMQEKLLLRDRTIQRLQTELDETRTMYESDIARMQAAHAQWRQESERETAALKMQLAQVAPAGNSTVNTTPDAGEFLEALNFKERLLDEMQDAFQRASQEWKNDTARTVAGIRRTVEEEVRSVVHKAESLVEELQTALSTLAASRLGTTSSLTAEAVGRLLQEEAMLLSSWEAKLREHVRTTVKRAVRGRVKDILRPFVERELQGHRVLGMPLHPSPVHAAPTVEAAGVASSPPVLALSPSPSPDAVRYGAVPALEAVAVVRGVTARTQNGVSDGPGRPMWLKRFCY